MSDGVKGKRFAYSPDLGVARVDPNVAELVRAAAARFTELGAIVEEVTIPWGKDEPELFRFLWPVSMTSLAQHLPKWEAEMDPGLVACIKEAAHSPVPRFLEMRRRKMDFVANIHRWFQDWDFPLTPCASVAAFPVEKLNLGHQATDWDESSWAEFTPQFNMPWNPAASVPCGFTPAGLPVGLQIVGKRFDDLGVLQASAAFEQLQPWADKRPEF
ncbi:amidase family protein [Mesorhizobium sp. M0046]|uniref:amidase family protein n=1 Tax=Mesorhizobium sp. M0046 TaxID=2956858 RepID=UPI003336657A